MPKIPWSLAGWLVLFYSAFLLVFLFPSLKRQWIQRNLVQAETTQSQAVESVQSAPIVGYPTQLKIRAIGLDIPITTGEFSAKGWTNSPSTAVFADVTNILNNESGMTFIYGHHTPQVFGKTDQLALGDFAEVQTKEGVTFVYQLTSVQQVSPNDTSVFEYDGPPRLTLLTCHGWNNSTRSLYHFSFVKVNQ